MKSTGIIRAVDTLGRVVIPISIRSTLGIDSTSSMEIFVDGNTITFRKYQPGCAFCGEIKGVLSVEGILVCRNCAAKIARAAR